MSHWCIYFAFPSLHLSDLAQNGNLRLTFQAGVDVDVDIIYPGLSFLRICRLYTSYS